LLITNADRITGLANVSDNDLSELVLKVYRRGSFELTEKVLSILTEKYNIKFSLQTIIDKWQSVELLKILIKIQPGIYVDIDVFLSYINKLQYSEMKMFLTDMVIKFKDQLSAPISGPRIA
jgi:hypothetical protein